MTDHSAPPDRTCATGTEAPLGHLGSDESGSTESRPTGSSPDESVADKGGKVVRWATDSSAFEGLARSGHLVSGLLHLLIAYIVIRLAFGDPGNADQSGALGIFASSTGGRLALWLAVIAFAAMALWRIAEVALGPHPKNPAPDDGDGWLDRAKAGALAVVYLGFAYSAATFALGDGKSSGSQNAGASARLMSSAFGKTVLVVVGIVIVCVGAYHIYKGVTQSFIDDLMLEENTIGEDADSSADQARSTSVTTVGTVGYSAKGAALAGAGILVIIAAITADPAKATGIDGAVKTVAGWPAGQALLVLMGLGIGAYGVYGLVMMRYARM